MNCLVPGNFIMNCFAFFGRFITSCFTSFGNFINYRINDDFFNGNLVSLFVNTFSGSIIMRCLASMTISSMVLSSTSSPSPPPGALLAATSSEIWIYIGYPTIHDLCIDSGFFNFINNLYCFPSGGFSSFFNRIISSSALSGEFYQVQPLLFQRLHQL